MLQGDTGGGVNVTSCDDGAVRRTNRSSRVATPDILSRFGRAARHERNTHVRGDRFGPDQDYAATYRALGGSRLAPDVVQAAIRLATTLWNGSHNDPERKRFVPRVLVRCAHCRTRRARRRESSALEDVIAQHERGRCRIPTRSRCDAWLAPTPSAWSRTFCPGRTSGCGVQRAGVLDLFAVTVFSSDGSSISRRVAV